MEEEVITHKSKMCDISIEDGVLYSEVDIPTFGGSETGIFGFNINYCPICGRKIYIKNS